MGYVFQFLRKKFGDARNSVQATFHPQSPAIHRESSLLASENIANASYGSVNTEEVASLGLTDPFDDWFHSYDAVSKAKYAIFFYIGIAILGYSFIFEEWSILDSVYFAVTVFTTVGYGDLAPASHASRMFTVLFASIGIIILGIFLGILGTRIFEAHNKEVKKIRKSVSEKILKQFSSEDTSEDRPERTFSQDVVEILGLETPMLLILGSIALPVIYLEDWDLSTGIYWMFVTGTTVGFGDLSPTHTWTKVICIIYLPLAAAVFGELLAQIAGAYTEGCKDKIEDAFLDRSLKIGDIKEMDKNGDNKVSEVEFLRYMLATMQKVGKEDFDELLKLFEELDENNNGYLDYDDLSEKYKQHKSRAPIAFQNVL